MKTLGRVILVGAGPGAPDLITLRGMRALEEADAILHDELASPLLLSHARSNALLINVGKRGHEVPTRTQEEIQDLLVSLALEGKLVVRLKGGDPYVFGRGGEEVSACRQAGIPFEVVPGVSSATGGLSYAGLTVTDRRYSASFAVVTGHKDPSAPSRAIDWGRLAAAVDTLIVLMGMRNLAEITRQMMAGGRSSETPAAAVMSATTPRQRTVVSTLAELAKDVERAGLKAPCAIVIGEVVQLRSELEWFEALPLFARRIVVTRQQEQAGAWCRALEAAGAETLTIPMIQISPVRNAPGLTAAMDSLANYDLILLASANAAQQLALRAAEAKADLGRVRARVVTVGEASSEAALAAGLPVERISTEGPHAMAMLESLRARGGLQGARVLLPRAERGREVLGRGLREAGAHVDEIVVYRTDAAHFDVPALRQGLEQGTIDALTFASPSAVRNFAASMGDASVALPSHVVIAAIGPVTAEACRELGMRVDVQAARPHAEALVTALSQYYESQAARKDVR